ncbi:MAG: SDR family NAD(P)-dependent oxidoreductase [Euryarchaeota archaeon]|nr:SDR family NAD(P)-dependent oxidoreductase [Euryarchaeota archaeon]
MTTILLTGSAGFIGSRTAELLLDAGHSVVGVDNLNSAYDVRLKEWRLSRLSSREGFSFVRGDVTDPTTMKSVFAKHRFDAVLNLAARAGVRQSIADPRLYCQTNVDGAISLFEACRHHDVKKIVQASTSSLYGADTPRPFREDAATSRPLSPYAASKKAAETLAFTYHHLYGLDFTIPRYFTVYGPAGRPEMSIFRFVRWIAEGEPLLLQGTGAQERDFTFVEDIARGTIAAMTPLGYEIINLGSDAPTPLSTVISKLERLIGKTATFDRQAMHRADVQATWADISKAKKLLDWKPQVDLDTGLRATVDWYMGNRDFAQTLRIDRE